MYLHTIRDHALVRALSFEDMHTGEYDDSRWVLYIRKLRIESAAVSLKNRNIHEHDKSYMTSLESRLLTSQKTSTQKQATGCFVGVVCHAGG